MQSSPNTQACWDVCNRAHQPSDFMVSTGSDSASQMQNGALAGLVQQVRLNRNPLVVCPGGSDDDDNVIGCQLGGPCGKYMLEKYHIPSANVGLCVQSASGDGSRMCVNMCTTPKNRINKLGWPAGSLTAFLANQASACNGLPWWAVLLIVVFSLGLIAFLGYYLYQRFRRRGRTTPYKEEAFVEPEGSYEDHHDQYHHQEQYQDQHQHYEETRAPEPPAKRGAALDQEPEYFHRQPQQYVEPPAALTGSMKIRGLDEPVGLAHALNSFQPISAASQMGSPPRLQQSQTMLGGSHSLPASYTTYSYGPAVPVSTSTFATQLPQTTTYVTTPQSSVLLRPLSPTQGSAPFFSQLQRR